MFRHRNVSISVTVGRRGEVCDWNRRSSDFAGVKSKVIGHSSFGNNAINTNRWDASYYLFVSLVRVDEVRLNHSITFGGGVGGHVVFTHYLRSVLRLSSATPLTCWATSHDGVSSSSDVFVRHKHVRFRFVEGDDICIIDTAYQWTLPSCA